MEQQGRTAWSLIILLLAMLREINSFNVMVPAYFDPSTNAAAWTTLATAAGRLQGRVVAIANPASGPGSSAQSSYTSAISQLHGSTGRVIGYVRTTYSTRAASSVKSDVDSWYSFYPAIDGIFFDEAANVAGHEAYYRDLYNYVKNKNSSHLVVNNPGVNTLESYLFYQGQRVTSVVCIFESGTGFLTWSPSSWTDNYAGTNFYALAYNVSSSDYESIIDHAGDKNVDWIYVTDDTGANPWDTLPSYFLDEVDYINSS